MNDQPVSTEQPDDGPPGMKQCTNCKNYRPLSHFLRRTGRRSRPDARRGTCRECRRRSKGADPGSAPGTATERLPGHRPRRDRPAMPQPLESLPLALLPTRGGTVRMRGRTDKGRRWVQETDLETAMTLVREHAAVVVNRHTIRRLFTNRTFRKYILNRDNHTCHFCGRYGDTIDHLLPRAKGGHTTPVNCVCACNECNQSKADRDLDEFMDSL